MKTIPAKLIMFTVSWMMIGAGCNAYEQAPESAQEPDASEYVTPEGPQTDGFQIETRVHPEYTSYIDLDPEKPGYEEGESVTITARGGGRFTFDSWVEGIPEDAPNPFDGFTITSDTVVAASFTAGYLSDRPLIFPNSQIYYEGRPRDLYFYIHENQYPFRGIRNNGERVVFMTHSIEELPVAEKLPDTKRITLPGMQARLLGPGTHTLEFLFEGHDSIEIEVEIIRTRRGVKRDFNIASVFVDHGNAVLFELPNGESLLIDTGTREAAEKYLIPFLAYHLPENDGPRKRIDHVFISHWHYDHFEGLGALMEHFDIGSVKYNLAAPPNYYGNYDGWDDPDDPYGFGVDGEGNPTGFEPQHYDGFFVGNEFDIGGVEFTVLNAADYQGLEAYQFADQVHRNERSLVLRMEYNGFVYTYGGDVYQRGQQAMLDHFGPEKIRSHVYQANHHFHGGVMKEHLLALDPVLFMVSANDAVYDRDAYARVVLNEVIPQLKAEGRRYKDNLLTYEVGHTIVRVDGSEDWSRDDTRVVYDTWFVNSGYYREYRIPYLFRGASY
ncbi:MBL fold metallo-hydrolase [Balneolaceae bacterium ANBcel3]|nr:MBL fold metallo-hydrolase [Balneolaceae bacterium ANBcel3]